MVNKDSIHVSTDKQFPTLGRWILTKRFHTLAVLVAILMVPSLILAGASHKFGTAPEAIAVDSDVDNQVRVPLIITNQDHLTAMDIPLKYSDGVTLLEVDFENTRVSYFDLKVANINTEEQTVVIGLLPQMTPAFKPDLEAGTGVIANLIFRIDDPTIENITLDVVKLTNPNHDLIFVYHDENNDDAPISGALYRDGFKKSGATAQAINSAQAVNDARLVNDEMVVALPVKGEALPIVFELKQNYPNPFNPSTIISYALPKASHVTISIYNVLGREVVTLVDEEKAAGRYEVNWDASANASGVYFYRIQADDFSETKKMMMLK